MKTRLISHSFGKESTESAECGEKINPEGGWANLLSVTYEQKGEPGSLDKLAKAK